MFVGGASYLEDGAGVCVSAGSFLPNGVHGERVCVCVCVFYLTELSLE